MTYKIWPFIPQHGVDEVLEWKTDVLRARDKEQRVMLRNAPRQFLSYTFLMDEHTLSKARALAYGWGGRQFGVPVWTEVIFVGVVSSSDTSIAVDTTSSEYDAGGQVLIWQDDSNYTEATIASITGSQLNLSGPVGENFTAAYVCPLRVGKMVDGFSLQRGPNASIKGSVEFRVEDNSAYAAASGFPTLLGLEILTDTMYYLGGADEKIIREVDVMDNLTGKVYTPFRYTRSDQAFYVGFSLQTRTDIKRIRSWFHTLKGRLTPFWLISQAADLTLTSDVGASDTSIGVKSIGYEENYTQTAIRILRTNGVATYHRVTSGSTVGSVDFLTLSAAAGVAATVGNTESISFMRCVRLDSDRIEFSHQENHYASIKVPCIEVPVP